MNTVTAYVDEVLTQPYYIDNKKHFGKQHTNWWAVDIKYSDMGGSGKTTLHFNTKEKAKKVKEGYKFSH
ncbi:MAG: hypothetical protein ACOCRK_09395 [bacterium]